jgi:hypothetical protein
MPFHKIIPQRFWKFFDCHDAGKLKHIVVIHKDGNHCGAKIISPTGSPNVQDAGTFLNYG